MPLLMFIIFSVKNKLQQGSWQAVCDADLLPFVLQEKQSTQSRVPLYTTSIAAILAIIAMAGPTWQRIPTPVFRNAAALVIVLDLSRSMDASDIKPSRLARARYKIADLLKQRKDGQTALVVYAASAFTVTPLTDDTETINSQLSALNSNIMPAQGSNSALALQHAVQLFKNTGLQKGQILLITDDDKIQQAIDKADLPSAFQLSILGVGTADGAPIKLAQGDFLKDASGNIVLAKLNSHALRKAAQESGGIYQKITDTDADIDRLSHYFDQSAKHAEAVNHDLLLENWVEAGVWLLLPILLLSAFSFRRGLFS
ncbi:VWA domain-containing protein [Methyloprofundus sp.]|uniref:VWA domain-containing protein n=1 Tax=Methyloprofundus sp. TaxID=2020875 RepID=UPI003D0EDF7C